MQNEIQKATSFEIFSSALLVAGTCIGGGMLALPISSSPYGFLPSMLMMLLCCLFMTLTGLLYLEAVLWMKGRAHMNTLSTALLTPFWRYVCFIVYMFICYASLIAYIAGGGREIIFLFAQFSDISFANGLDMVMFALIFGCALYLGHRFVEKANSLLFIAMLISFILLIVVGSGSIKVSLLGRQRYTPTLFLTLPLFLTTFSFPGIVPTIIPYLKRDPKATRLAILSGTAITFLFYSVWLMLMFGSVPYEGPFGLKEALYCDYSASQCLHHALQNPWISASAQFFAFFAIVTSFFGISLALYDFLVDSFKAKIDTPGRKIMLCLMTLLPSLFFALTFEKVFVSALELSGGIGDAILSGLIPVMMVWRGRYHDKYQSSYRLFGGKTLLIVLFLISISIFFAEILRRFGFWQS